MLHAELPKVPVVCFGMLLKEVGVHERDPANWASADGVEAGGQVRYLLASPIATPTRHLVLALDGGRFAGGRGPGAVCCGWRRRCGFWRGAAAARSESA